MSKRALVQKEESKPDGKICFIISPIGASNSEIRTNFDKVRNHIIDPVALNKGYKTLRSDEISIPGRITSQIIHHLKNDELVVADLSRKNPNVYYELAIRHAVQKPVILISERDFDIPFDLAAQRVISYSLDPDDIIEAKKDLASQIDAVVSESFVIDSPVKDAIDMSVENTGSENQQFQRILAILDKQSAEIRELKARPSIRSEPKKSAISASTSITSLGSIGRDTVKVNPQLASVGDSVNVYSDSHTAGEVVQIYFDFVQPEFILSEVVARNDGVIEQVVTIPETEIGIHYFWVKDLATGISNRASIEIF